MNEYQKYEFPDIRRRFWELWEARRYGAIDEKDYRQQLAQLDSFWHHVKRAP